MKLKQYFHDLVIKIGHKAEHFCHMTYLGAVGIEGHGKYRYAAIVLLLVVIINFVAALSESE